MVELLTGPVIASKHSHYKVKEGTYRDEKEVYAEPAKAAAFRGERGADASGSGGRSEEGRAAVAGRRAAVEPRIRQPQDGNEETVHEKGERGGRQC